MRGFHLRRARRVRLPLCIQFFQPGELRAPLLPSQSAERWVRSIQSAARSCWPKSQVRWEGEVPAAGRVPGAERAFLSCTTGRPGARMKGEHKANMAKRPDFPYGPDVPLTAQDLADLRHRYALLSRPSLQQVYSDAWERCKLERSGRPPRAEQIQVLVAAWKALRKP